MSEYGLYIKEFEARGEDKISVHLSFEKGCNVVLGKSDIGKSTLFSIIEYVLCKNSKDILLPPEGDGYTDFYVELHTYNEDIYTLRRKIYTNSVYVCPCAICSYDQHSEKEYSCTNSSNINLSDFLLNISNIPIVKAKISEKRNPAKVSYSILRHLFMVDESRVTAKDRSPLVYEINPSMQWRDKNYVSYLMTGIDDSSFRPNEDPEVRKSKIKGKIEFLTDEIDKQQQQLSALGDVGYISLTDNSFITSYRNKLEAASVEESKLYHEKSKLDDRITSLTSSIKKQKHFIARLKDLLDGYLVELDRLQFINSGNLLISQLQDVVCPLCGAPLDKHHFSEHHESALFDAIRNEYLETSSKITDLNLLIADKETDLSESFSELNAKQKQLDEITNALSTIQPNISDLKNLLERAEKNLEKRFLHEKLSEEIQLNKNNIDSLSKELSSIKSDNNAQREDVTDDFLQMIKQNLVSWNFIQPEIDVNFNYKTFDVVIGSRQRSSYGKGNRAITFTAVMMALMDYCVEKQRPFSGMLIIDSPLCTKYGDKVVDNDKLTLGTIDAFSHYCNTKDWKYQLIIMDNKFTENRSLSELDNVHIIDIESEGGLFKVN